MTISYSANLGLINITTGTESGLWGGYTNTNICSLLEQAIAGYSTQTMASAADTTVNITNGALSTGRSMYIKCTSSMAQANNLIVPTVTKLYLIENATTGGFNITVKTSGGTGIAVAPGLKMLLMCDGTNVIDAINYINSSTGPGTFTTLSASSTVSGAGFSNYFAVPPPLGSTSPNTGAFTTVTASSTVTLNPPNANVTISPTGTGAVTISPTTSVTIAPAGTAAISPTGALTINPTAASTINNTSIGVTTSAVGKFTQAYTASATLGVITTSLAPNCATSNVFYCTATSATAFTCAPTNMVDGQTINIFITQPASGSNATWTATWAKWSGGAATAALSTALGAIDLVVATYRGGVWYASIARAFS